MRSLGHVSFEVRYLTSRRPNESGAVRDLRQS